MGVRGRKSAASMAISVASPELEKLPQPTAYLSPEEDTEWRRIISSRAGDIIGVEAYSLLVEYCRAIVIGNKIAAQLDAFDVSWLADDDGLKRFDKLHQIAARNQGVMTTLATKLRISTTSTIRPENASTIMKKGEKKKPWEFDNE